MARIKDSIQGMGITQMDCLIALRLHRRWSYEFISLQWSTPSETLKLMKSLETRGLAEKVKNTYRITKLGEKVSDFLDQYITK